MIEEQRFDALELTRTTRISKEEAFSELFEAAGKSATAESYRRSSADDDEGHYQVLQLPAILARKVADRYAGQVDHSGQAIDHYCGIVLSHRDNAGVGYRNGTFCIGIYDGLIKTALEVVFWIFRSPHFMNGLGAASSMPGTKGELTVPAGQNWVYRTLHGLQPVLQPDFFRISCPVRERAAMQMIVEILSFVMWHEFQHIIQGHVTYLQGSAGVAFVSEDGGTAESLPEEVLRTQRVFEYEADWAAFREMQRGRSLESAGLSANRYRATLRRIRQLAPFLALYLFTFDWASKANLSPSTHPDPFRRMYALLRRIKAEPDATGGNPDHLRIDVAGMANALVQPAVLGIFDEHLNEVVKEITDEEYVLAAEAIKQARALGFKPTVPAP